MTLTADAEVVLAELKVERVKFTRADDEKMQRLCDQLVEMGVYPAVSGIGYTPFKMMEAWGVDWYKYQGTMNCPACGTDLCDRNSGPPFKREIGIIERDYCVAYQCPDCNHEWGRPGFERYRR